MSSNVIDFIAYATRHGAPVEFEMRPVANVDCEAILFRVGKQTTELRLYFDDAETLFEALTKVKTGREFVQTLTSFLADPELELPNQLEKPANDD